MNPIGMRPRARAVGAGALVVGLLGAGGAPAAERLLDRQRIRALVEKSLPTWDKRVLEVKEGRDWSGDASIAKVLEAVQDKPFAGPPRPGERRLADEGRVARLYGERGKLRYASRERAWKVDQISKPPIDPKAAGDVARKALGSLGLPENEFGELRVAAQIGQGASTKRPEDKQRFQMYQVVSLGRRVNDIPVYGSKARAAIANSGSIQRLQVDWPAFRVPSGLALRSKDEVVAQAVREISAQQPREDTQINAYLAYAPTEITRPYRPKRPTTTEEKPGPDQGRDDETTHRHDKPPRFRSAEPRKEPVRFVPVVVVSVLSLPTPYQLIVPVTTAR